MAGRIAAPLAKAMRRRGVDIELFVAMAASPGLPNLLPGFASLAAATSGLARVEGAFLEGLLACLQAQNEENGRAAISPERFLQGKRDVTAAGHYAAITCEAARLHFHGSSSSIFVLG
jgi:hypothetical protein